MRLIFIALFIISLVPVYGQALKKVKTGDEIFYVLSSDRGIRHGKYQRKGEGGIIEVGQYDKNKKVGIWEFYGTDKKLEQKFDYSERELIYNDDAKKYFIRSLIIKDGRPTDIEPDVNPVLIGGPSKYFRHVFATFKYPVDAKTKGTQGVVLVGGVINSQGKLERTEVLQGLGDGLDEQSLEVLNSLDGEWIPARHGDEIVEAMVIFRISYKLS